MNSLASISIVQPRNNKDAKVFDDFKAIFDCTSNTFFDGQLTYPVFSFSRNPRLKGAFLADRYFSVDGKFAHGVVLNSDYARAVGDTATIALLGFLIAQLARRKLGPAGKNGLRGTPGYVDAWTRDKLLSMGLTPTSDDDDPRQLGYGLSANVEEDGAFDLMCCEMLVSGFAIRWHERPVATESDDDAPAKEKPPKPSRARFLCEDCGLIAHAKPSAHFLCGCNGRALICTTEKGN